MVKIDLRSHLNLDFGRIVIKMEKLPGGRGRLPLHRRKRGSPGRLTANSSFLVVAFGPA